MSYMTFGGALLGFGSFLERSFLDIGGRLYHAGNFHNIDLKYLSQDQIIVAGESKGRTESIGTPLLGFEFHFGEVIWGYWGRLYHAGNFHYIDLKYLSQDQILVVGESKGRTESIGTPLLGFEYILERWVLDMCQLRQ